jgi:hypothetical protein
MQSRNPGSTKPRIFDARFLALAASLAYFPSSYGVIFTNGDIPSKGPTRGGIPVGIANSGNTAIVSGDTGQVSFYTDQNLINPSVTSITHPDSKNLASENSNGTVAKAFGSSLSIYGNMAIVGVPIGAGVNGDGGSIMGTAFVYRVDDLSGLAPIQLAYPKDSPYPTIDNGNVTLIAGFGLAVDIFNDSAIVTVGGDDGAARSSAFLYTGLNNLDFSGTSSPINATAQLFPSDHYIDRNHPDHPNYETTSDSIIIAATKFGSSVGISDNIVIVGDGLKQMGTDVTDSGDVGSYYVTTGGVYVYKREDINDENLVPKIPANPGNNMQDQHRTVSGYFETFQLKASDAIAILEDGDKWWTYSVFNGDEFGSSVGISNTNNVAIVGAPGKKFRKGAVYIYTNLMQHEKDDSVAGVTETYQLKPSDQTKSVLMGDWDGDEVPDGILEYDWFGYSVVISEDGDTAIVGAPGKDQNKGAIYIYTGLLDHAQKETGESKEETLKLFASSAVSHDGFGGSLDMEDGTDNFIVGTGVIYESHQGDIKPTRNRAYTGRVSTFTTVDGGVHRATEGLSFVSKTDWIIGNTTADNKVTLSNALSISTDSGVPKKNEDGTTTYGDFALSWFPDEADVKNVYIGKGANAHKNQLIIEGTLKTEKIYIGNNGTTYNSLVVKANQKKIAGSIPGTSITITNSATHGQIEAKEILIGSPTSKGNALILEGEILGTIANLKLTFPDPAEAENDPLKIVLHKDNYLIIWGFEQDDAAGPKKPLAPKVVAQALQDANIQLMAGWKKDENGNPINIAESPDKAADFVGTSIGGNDMYGMDLSSYTVVRAKTDAGGTPEPSTYALIGSVLLAGLMLIHRRGKRANPPQK